MSTNKIKRSIYNLGTSLFSTIVAIALGLVIPRIVLVNYGSETNGLINSINQFVTYLSLFEAGIGSAALQVLYKPVAENDQKSINSIMTALNYDYRKVGFYYLITLFALSIVYPLVSLNSNSELTFLEVFLCVMFSGLGNVVVFYVQGKYRILLTAEGKTYILTNLQTVISTLNSFAKILLLLLGFDVVFVIIATFSVNLIQAIYIMYLVKKEYSWIVIGKPSDKVGYTIKQKGYVFVHQIAWMVFQNTDVIVLTIACGLKTVSVYSMFKLIISNIEKLIRIPLDSTSFALGQVYNTDSSNKKRYCTLLDCFEVYYTSIYFSVFAAVFCLLIPFLRIYTRGVTDINYLDGYLPCLFIGVELLSFMRLLGLNTITYAGKFKETTPQTIIETVINIVVSLVAVMHWGIYGVLLGTIIALLYRFFDIVFYTNKVLLKRSTKKTFSIYIINILLFCIYATLFGSLNPIIENYIQFFKVGLESTSIFIVSGIAINTLLYKNERRIICKMIVSKIFKKS